MKRVRSVFISDVHLGTRACQADRLLEFLRDYSSDYLYLIGDIVDFWAMNRSVQWAPSHNTVVQKVLRRARHGDTVILIPGNHDEALREHAGTVFGDIRVELEWVHTAADGQRYLLVHGDQFDQVTLHHRWLAVLGDIGYNTLVRANLWLSRLRRLLRIPGYWSLAGYAKRKVKTAVGFIFDFEDSVARETRKRQLDGVVCGHIHWATEREIGGVRYLNCGDWVDSCSAIVEHHDGRMEVIHWTAAAVVQPVRTAQMPAANDAVAARVLPAPDPSARPGWDAGAGLLDAELRRPGR